VDRTAQRRWKWILTGLQCRWAPYVRGHGPGQGQLPVSNIKAPGHRYPDARGSTCPPINVGGEATGGKYGQAENKEIPNTCGIAGGWHGGADGDGLSGKALPLGGAVPDFVSAI